MKPAVFCQASPSLALLKYWGKQDSVGNIPATPSIAVALAGLLSSTRVRVLQPREGSDRVVVNGTEQPPARFEKFFDAMRARLRSPVCFEAESTNNFPTAAGLASSSSGFAALAIACTRAAGESLPERAVSSLARVGSASAARAVYGGFTLLPAGAKAARPLYDETHWPELRVVVCVTEKGPKATSSRAAMEASRLTSPYYRAWLRASARALPHALRALETRDLEQLGEAMRLSYLRMFATIISTDPPTQYWLPQSVAIVNECERLRQSGVGVWETMDAGPQVKLLCLADSAPAVRERIEELEVEATTIECGVGGAPEWRVEGQ